MTKTYYKIFLHFDPIGSEVFLAVQKKFLFIKYWKTLCTKRCRRWGTSHTGFKYCYEEYCKNYKSFDTELINENYKSTT